MKVGIIGLGLMGGSLGRALVKKTECTVYAYDSDKDAMLKGAMLGAYHERLTEENAAELDVLVLAILPSAMKTVLDKYLPRLKAGTIVTDVAGVKRPVTELMRAYSVIYPDVAFTGGHPMAGREFSGVAHSTASLYEGCTVLLVNVSASLEKLAALKNLYKEVGAEGAVLTTAEEHDKIIAYTSQLAHVVSSAYVKSPSAMKHYGYSAGSFRDMTRVARMNAGMWTELMSDNADYLAEEVRGVAARLNEYADSLERGDTAKLYELLDVGSNLKTSLEKDRQKKLNLVMSGLE